MARLVHLVGLQGMQIGWDALVEWEEGISKQPSWQPTLSPALRTESDTVCRHHLSTGHFQPFRDAHFGCSIAYRQVGASISSTSPCRQPPPQPTKSDVQAQIPG
ncbi:hypothetical protein BAUCODRAFT_331793 [Baudoinia panamericana UAMH 10762]|uniref:Uncharacterized protein n=1 Tax=Baudoinia panamericana (strain UAMH 10762) TaxID=717646 RepID=M2MXE8_BAUPA|nr:uncharacterized protein BAUCODRAFT_331793 [Baudoinia panamericana UAMH 10762]EMC90930.1 hypothetical protein BAUCODRAFT_331793 [Baudoinia panamericana UAMH 10762]